MLGVECYEEKLSRVKVIDQGECNVIKGVQGGTFS